MKSTLDNYNHEISELGTDILIKCIAIQDNINKKEWKMI